MELFSNLLNDLSTSYDTIFIFGDLNIDILKFNSCKNASEYIDLLFSFGLIQTVTKPSRCTINSATLIDHCIITPKFALVENILIVNKISDHFPIITICYANTKSKTAKEFSSREFSINNVNKFKEAVKNFNANFVLENEDTQEAFRSFSNFFHNMYEMYFPIITSRFNKNIHRIEKWMSKGILISRLTKIKLGKLCHSSPSAESTAKFKLYRNLFNIVVRNAKKLYYEKTLAKVQSNKKKLGLFTTVQ